MLPWYCPISAMEMPFSSLSNKEFNLSLSRNPLDSSAQAITSKKIDKHTEEILKKLSNLNKFFDHTENNVSCDYLDINEYKKIKIKEQDFSLLHLNISSLPSQKNKQRFNQELTERNNQK